MSYLLAALICIVVAQIAALVVLARAAQNARERAREHARQETEAGAVAHDLNNTLSVVLNYASFVLEDLPQGDPRRDDVVEINRAAKQAGILTRSLNGHQEPRNASARLSQAPRKRRAAA
jgi:histidinol-phosphate/aromatic aminotransferase/cobyric acid decarboxylase-like protein